MKKYGVLLKKIDYFEVDAESIEEAQWKAYRDMQAKDLLPDWLIDEIRVINE